MKAGWIGLRQTGVPMALQIPQSGHDLKAFVRKPREGEDVRAAGAVACGSGAEAAFDVDILGVCLFDDHQIRQALILDGALTAMRADSEVMVHTTGDPELFGRLPGRGPDGSGRHDLQRRQLRHVPVSGRRDGVRPSRADQALSRQGRRDGLRRPRRRSQESADDRGGRSLELGRNPALVVGVALRRTKSGAGEFQSVRAARRPVLHQEDFMVGTRRPSRRRDLHGLTITELARLAGTTARALRHYEKFDLLTPHRGRHQERFYSPASVGRALQVVRLRRLGVSLADIARIMKDGDTGGLRQIIEERLVDVDSQREQLAALLERLKTDETAGWMREAAPRGVNPALRGRCETGVESTGSRA